MMLHLLKRHPFPVTAFFRQSLVLTYAFPHDVLTPLLPPGLVLDTYGEFGFLAIAMVQTERLRPSFVPAALGRNFFLSGYRIFTRLGKHASSLRGLRILRSDTDRWLMVRAGNLLTHYSYRLCRVKLTERPGAIEWSISTPREEADLEVIAHVAGGPASLPVGSPFANEKDARRFAGPLPYTFDYEPETHSIIRIRGVRHEWNPKQVAVEVHKNTFLQQEPFCRVKPVLANAFYLHDVPYRWERGERKRLEEAA
jgi:Uncharacterized conserved protein (COG2071)